MQNLINYSNITALNLAKQFTTRLLKQEKFQKNRNKEKFIQFLNPKTE
ncbi:14326_t:CDS:2 [Acaulospora colombiana]|uniref:14326_t:CDS:1 n=1 Tax=Acaulospora colombiana TaxID=27376 RepID=A0ACA9K7I7_9GLOM|nr:14326_t:CDS:2 [Acaulospora colombiana]